SRSIVTSTVKNRPNVTIAHQRRSNPVANRTTAATATAGPGGSSNIQTPLAQRKVERDTKIPAAILSAITTQIIPSVLRSCFVPVLLRDRRVSVSSTSEAKKINPSFDDSGIVKFLSSRIAHHGARYSRTRASSLRESPAFPV